jgi:dimethylhistidine N-methyltransferase
MPTSSKPLDIDDRSPETAHMADEILAGLSASPKYFPSHYLYDERGLALFNEICETPEYYITRTEIAILDTAGEEIAQTIGAHAVVIAPGSGAGIKPRMLLDALHEPAAYVPIDISCEHLQESANEINRDFPTLRVAPICADFTNGLELPELDLPAERHVVYFPGSTIGNFNPGVRRDMLRMMRGLCTGDGGILIGVDLKKDVGTLEAAYDDAGGVSARFALNILTRLNRELEADCDLEQFTYGATYDAERGRIQMAIESLTDQTVHITGQPVEFAAGEKIRTEWSYKFSLEEFAALAEETGLRVQRVWTDPKNLFSIQYLLPIRDADGA